MQLIYEDIDIMDKVGIAEAVTTDVGGGRADGIELCLFDAADWLSWGPKPDDRIEITDAGYRTGAMYIDTLVPEGDKYRIRAYSMPIKARERRWASYERVTLRELVGIVAGELGMDARFFGVNERVLYPYLTRRNETAVAFLQRILSFECALLKCFDGTLTALDLLWAQRQRPVCEMTMDVELSGVQHNLTEGRGISKCIINSPFGMGSAVNAKSWATGTIKLADEPVFDGIQAARWARGRLLMETRTNEQLKWAQDFNPAMTGLVRVDVTAPGALGGQWILDQVQHDHVERKSDCTFLRVIDSIT